MTAATKLTAEELADAPRIWSRNQAGLRVRIVDPAWMSEHKARARASQTAIAPDLLAAYRQETGPAGRIIARVAELHGVKVADIKGPSRRHYLIAARFQAAYELRKMGKTLPEIGRLFSGRDHTSILHAIRSWPKRAAMLGVPVDLEPEA